MLRLLNMYLKEKPKPPGKFIGMIATNDTLIICYKTHRDIVTMDGELLNIKEERL